MKLNVFMVGSVPMSLSDLQLAPAVLAAHVRRRGHNFGFMDINLDLFVRCNRDQDAYTDAYELLQDLHRIDISLPVIDQWLEGIMDQLHDQHILLVNVFSVYSQGAAYRLITRVRKRWPLIKILTGGVGSHKKIFGTVSEFNHDWLKSQFQNIEDLTFGSLMVNNALADDWQHDVSTSILDRHLPSRAASSTKALDFSDYGLDLYQWKHRRQIPMLGSHGCVRQCQFCDVVVHFPRYNFVQADELTKQIVSVYQQTNIANVQFMDSLVNGNMKNFLALLQNLIQAKQQGWLPPDFAWSGTYICRPKSKQLSRIHELLAPSGADSLIIGVETGSDRVRFEMDKKFTNADLINEIKGLNAHGVRTVLLFFPSWPTESIQEYHETLDLLRQLSVWSHLGTIQSITISTSGFVLHDNTPIDFNKDKFGLVAGPANYLWKCELNPDLIFWESLRRRMLMSAYVRALGINLIDDARVLRLLKIILSTNMPMIKSYAGDCPNDLLPEKLPQELWDTVCTNTVKMSLVNSGSSSVHLTVQDQHFDIVPGTTDIEVVWHADSKNEIKFQFDRDHVPCWQRWPNGEFYAANGIYIQEFLVDQRNITFSAFVGLFAHEIVKDVELPDSFENNRNPRAIVADTRLTLFLPPGRSLQEQISRCLDPEQHQELDHLVEQIRKLLVP